MARGNSPEVARQCHLTAYLDCEAVEKVEPVEKDSKDCTLIFKCAGCAGKMGEEYKDRFLKHGVLLTASAKNS